MSWLIDCKYIKGIIQDFEDNLDDNKIDMKYLKPLVSGRIIASILNQITGAFEYEPKKRFITQLEYVLKNFKKIIDGIENKIPEFKNERKGDDN
ncbi:MAG: hypothetical protein ACFFCI_01100 [Promethearchaeota archaeon]